MMGHVKRISTVALLCVLSTPAAVAQSETGPSWVEIRQITVRGDCMDEWREAQRDGVNPALQAAGVTGRSAFRDLFGNTARYTFVSPIPDFAQYEQQQGRVQIPSSAGEVLGRCTESRSVGAWRLERDLSNVTTQPSDFVVVTTQRLAPGADEAWRALIRSNVLPAAQEASTNFWVFQSLLDGPVGFVTVAGLNSLSAVDDGPFFLQGLGQEAAASLARRRQALQLHVERYLQRRDPELSF
jgi:hypothetical protein